MSPVNNDLESRLGCCSLVTLGKGWSDIWLWAGYEQSAISVEPIIPPCVSSRSILSAWRFKPITSTPVSLWSAQLHAFQRRANIKLVLEKKMSEDRKNVRGAKWRKNPPMWTCRLIIVVTSGRCYSSGALIVWVFDSIQYSIGNIYSERRRRFPSFVHHFGEEGWMISGGWREVVEEAIVRRLECFCEGWERCDCLSAGISLSWRSFVIELGKIEE